MTRLLGLGLRKIKLSMKVGGEYRLQDVGRRQWRNLAQEVRIDEGRLIDRLVAMAEQVSDALADGTVTAEEANLLNKLRSQLGVEDSAWTAGNIVTGD